MKAKETEHTIYRREIGTSGKRLGTQLRKTQAYDLRSAVLSTGVSSQRIFLRWTIMSGLGYDTGLPHLDALDCDIYKTMDGVAYKS